MGVKLTTEKFATGSSSLYLDIYENTESQYQNRLKLYLVPEKTEFDKVHNKELIRLGEIIKNNFELQLLKKRYREHNPRENII